MTMYKNHSKAKLFRIFQEVLHAPRDTHQEELRRLGIYVVRKFVEIAPTNAKIYAELLFYKSIKEANELESGYCDAYESGTKGTWGEEQEAELRFLFEENQRNPQNNQDVIDWMLDNIIDKTRTRRGVLKKLKEMGLMFKAPTKKSTAAANNKNLWKPEEDEELRSLYDQYRLEEDCLERIMQEFEERRNKQQIIKRMLQLHIIADKSEILPQKPRKRKSKKKQDLDEVDVLMEEPNFGEEATDVTVMRTKKRKKTIKAPKRIERKIVRTPLDVGTVRTLLAQIDTEKYQEALDWLKECLNEAAEDTNEPLEEDDGVPLLTLSDVQREAMEDADFMKVLVALGIQPPIAGMESYWRIPIYLNSADLMLRAKIVAGEDVSVEIDENTAEADVEEEEEDDEEEEEDTGSEDDYLENLQRQRAKLNSLMFSKSDEETEQRLPLASKPRKLQNKRKPPKTAPEDSEDDEATVTMIQKKLQRRGEISSSDDDEKLSHNMNTLFDQLKPKRTSPKPKEIPDELDFNSEDLRARLLELAGSESESVVEENSINTTRKSKKRVRRTHIIDSDSDEHQENENKNDDDDDDDDDDDVGKASDITKKRLRSPAASVNTANDNDYANETVVDEVGEIAGTLTTKNSNGKRRRVGVITDD